MLTISNISKTFNPGTVNERKALNDLSLHLDKGDFVSVIGANGAGKSTLFNAISGNFLTDSGSIMLGGRDITFQAEYIRAKKIGRLFQDPKLGTAPDMSIEENMALASGRGKWFSHISKADRDFFRERLALLDMGLEDRLKHKVGLLSGGQRQALSLLMATMVPPNLLLLDEHTAALDPAAAEKVLALTKDIIDKDKLTCLMITHNIRSALELGNRTVMMNDGKIILDVSGEERAALTVDKLVARFKEGVGKELDNDRMLLS